MTLQLIGRRVLKRLRTLQYLITDEWDIPHSRSFECWVLATSVLDSPLFHTINYIAIGVLYCNKSLSVSVSLTFQRFEQKVSENTLLLRSPFVAELSLFA